MVKNYLKTAFRAFNKSKLTSLINIGSLAVGIACCIIIILYVKNELTFDQFHSKADRIYRVWNEMEIPGRGTNKQVYTPYNMTRLMAEDYEAIEAYTTFSSTSLQVQYGDQHFPETIHLASAGFFQMFDFESVEGSLDGALHQLENIVITEKIAHKYFGDKTAIGEQLEMPMGEGNRLFTVVAVLEDMPSNSSLTFDFLVSDENAKYVFPEAVINTWHMIVGVNYVLLKENSDVNTVEAGFTSLVDKVLGKVRPYELRIYLQPLLDIHLNNDMPAGYASVSDPQYSYVLMGIGILILVLGCVNFMILSVGKSSARSKEIGVRKAIGANKGQLAGQLFTEGMLVGLIALIVALLLARVVLPIFNELSDNSLALDLHWTNMLLFVGLALVVGLVASIYPALVISSFNPSKVLKGKAGVEGGKHHFKMILITCQFVLSIFFVSVTVLMQQQLNFMQNKNLGFDAEQVISVPISAPSAGGLKDEIRQSFTKAETFKTRVQSSAGVAAVGATSQVFGTEGWMKLGWDDAETGNERSFRMNIVDHGYIETMGMELTQGRNFDEDSETDQRRAIIVNEAFVKEFGIENPIGAQIPSDRAIDHEIIGVVKDFHFASLHTSIEPLLISQNVDIGFSAATSVGLEASPNAKVLLKIAPNTFQTTIKEIEHAWQATYGDEPFDYNFIAEGLDEQYKAEQNLGKIVSAATILALLIGCMGLFAMATLTMNARVKEISVRKVLGAPMTNIIYLLSRSYVIVILIALVISIPLTVYVATGWLNEFEYRIVIGAESFMLAGVATLIIAIVTISYQCVKVAKANPASTLAAE